MVVSVGAAHPSCKPLNADATSLAFKSRLAVIVKPAIVNLSPAFISENANVAISSLPAPCVLDTSNG